MARDKALNALDTWVSAFRAICRVALADDPQQLEQLGIVVLNQSRRNSPKRRGSPTRRQRMRNFHFPPRIERAASRSVSGLRF